MGCRIDIKGRLVWVDSNNEYNSRPSEPIIINLLRDNEIIKTIEINPKSDGRFKFPCLPIWKNANEKYIYSVDEPEVPVGYLKTVQGNNIISTLDTFEATVTKKWVDNYNEEKKRPSSILLMFFQNDILYTTTNLFSPPDTEDTAFRTFSNLPFADSQGMPYIYTVDEGPMNYYKKSISGLSITNTLVKGFTFYFSKTSAVSGLPLSGAVFELSQGGTTIVSATSDANGNVSFFDIESGTYQMEEIQPPPEYINNSKIYEVFVSSGGTATIDGQSIASFIIENTPEPIELTLSRATAVNSVYMSAPNTWHLHGGTETDLYMTDRILISLQPVITPVSIKWISGKQNIDFFRQGGGNDITDTYTQGVPVDTNSDYTVYVLRDNGADAIASITIDRIRDGSSQMPYLLVDFNTANGLNSSIPGIEQFTLYYLQGGGAKLLEHYEIYEDIDMQDRLWQPVGSMEEGFSGTLYGNGHNITNLSLENASNNSGLFTLITDSAKIQNLGLTNCNITSISGIIGGFTANIISGNYGSVLLKNLYFQGTLFNSGNGGNASAIAGYTHIETNSSLTIDSCNVDAVITSDLAPAGIISDSETYTGGSTLINNCHTSGSVTASGNMGIFTAGIVGACDANGGPCSITNCSNAMTILAKNFMAGGIVGYAHSNNDIKVSACFNRGSVTAARQVGGLVGHFANNAGYTGPLTIVDCYNTGTVTQIDNGSSGTGVGGLIGSIVGKCFIKNSYNVANVVSYIDKSGGIVSDATQTTIENCAVLSELVSSIDTLNRTGRIIALKSLDIVLTNNIAYDNMQLLINGVQKTPLDVGDNAIDGLSVSSSAIKTQELYETTLGWDFTNVWSFGNGTYMLPILRNIPSNLQPVILPSHL